MVYLVCRFPTRSWTIISIDLPLPLCYTFPTNRLCSEITLVRHEEAWLKSRLTALVQGHWVWTDMDLIEVFLVILEFFCCVHSRFQFSNIPAAMDAFRSLIGLDVGHSRKADHKEKRKDSWEGEVSKLDDGGRRRKGWYSCGDCTRLCLLAQRGTEQGCCLSLMSVYVTCVDLLFIRWFSVIIKNSWLIIILPIDKHPINLTGSVFKDRGIHLAYQIKSNQES